MLIEEEEGKTVTEVNPEAFEAMFEDEAAVAEEEVFLYRTNEEQDEVDLAFTEDEGYW